MKFHGFVCCSVLVCLVSGIQPPQNLRTEYLSSEGVVISTSSPRFSWFVENSGGARGENQYAFQIQVIDAFTQKLIHDSNQQISSALQFKYNGPDLQSLSSFQWQVRWWLNASTVSAYSQATFTVGPRTDADWHSAAWVGDEKQRMLRASFSVSCGSISSALAFVAAPGCFDLEVNGQPFEGYDQCPWLQFDRRMFYNMVNVTAALHSGDNALGMMLGHGFYRFGGFADAPVMKMLLHITCSDGSTSSVVTSTNSSTKWIATEGIFLEDDPFQGVNIDFRKLPANWTRPVFTPDSSWSPLLESKQPPSTHVLLVASSVPQPVIERTLSAVSLVQLPNGHYVFDFGANIVGVSELSISAPADAHVRLVHGEVLFPNGSVNNVYAGAKSANIQVDNYTFAEGSFTVVPTFTWHGFQYVEAVFTGFPDSFKPSKDMLKALYIHTELPQTVQLSYPTQAGDDASDPGTFLNALNDIILRTQKNNLAAALPTDCPTREKHGWLGDAQTTGEEAMLSFDTVAIHEQFLRTIRDAQSDNGDVPGAVPIGPRGTLAAAEQVEAARITDISWSAAFPLITSWLYLYHGDVGIVEEMYPALAEFVDFLNNAALSEPGKLADFFIWGDWCAVQSRAVATPATGPELAAFNWLLSLDAMVLMAEALGNETGASHYRNISQVGRKAFHERFYNTSAGLYNAGYALDAQSLTAAPFVLGNTIPANMQDDVLAAFVDNVASFDNHLTWGSVGARHVMDSLASQGHYDVAMDMMTKTDFPSFGHWMQLGATTCWENWSGQADASHPPPPTHGHIFLCAGALFTQYHHTAGLQPLKPGFQEFLVKPQIHAGPTSTSFRFQSVRGVISVDWHFSATQESLELNTTAPLGSTAHVRIPFPSKSLPSAFYVYEAGVLVWNNGSFLPTSGITAGQSAPDGVLLTLTSGSFHFVAKTSQ